MKVRLLHISDLHFGTIVETALAGVLDVIATCAPDVVVISGDVTQRSRSDEFADLRDFLALIAPIPVLVCAGNHDVEWRKLWRRLTTPLLSFNAAVPEAARVSMMRIGDVVIGPASSVDPLRPVAGRISLATVAATARALDVDGAPIRVAFTHHPLAIDRPAAPPDVCIDAAMSASALSAAGIDLLLSGHVHVPFAMTTALPFPTLPPFVLAGAGTAMSHRTRGLAPRSIQIVEIGADTIAIERREMGPGQPGFGVVGVSHFVRGADGWTTADP